MAKAPPKVEPPVEMPVAKPKKKRLLIIGVALALLGSGGAGAWYFTQQNSDPGAAKAEPPALPVFVSLEPFTVNLQPDNGEQYLQVALTLQVSDEAQTELIKLHMPQVRSRLLLLLSSKQASEILTVEGKNHLASEIIAQLKQPFTPKAAPQNIRSVFFTSFVIQ